MDHFEKLFEIAIENVKIESITGYGLSIEEED